MIKDWNRENLNGKIFHFKNSLRPFIDVSNKITHCDFYFLDLNEKIFYSFDELEDEGLEFYTKDDDPDFKGVDVCGIFAEITE